MLSFFTIRHILLFVGLLFSFFIARSQVFIPYGYWANNSPLTLSPASVVMAVSTTQQFIATGGFSVKTYSLVSGVGSINSSTGLYTAPASTGNAVVRVTDSKGITVDAAISVVTTVTGITVSQSVVSGGVGASVSVTAQVTYTPSGSIDVTNSGTWTTSDASVATVVNGVITFVSAGTATITITSSGFSQTVSVTVANKTLSSIAVTPASVSMAVNATQNYRAIATYSDASSQDITTSVTWASSSTSVATISNTAPTKGKATGLTAGATTISATMGAVSGSTTLTINAATLVSIAITPYDYLASSSMTYQLTATGTFSDGSTSDITEQVTWSSSNTSAATISTTSGTKGKITTPTFTGYLTTTITATLGAVSGTTPFGVDGATVSAIIVKPIVTIQAGTSYSLEAWANLSDGGTINVTQYAVWSSATTSKVTVSNGAGTQGMVTGVANGTSVITATYGGVSGTRTVTVGAVSAMTDVGIGLNADYYSWTGGAPPSPFIFANKKGTRIDANVDFAWGNGAAPMGITDNFAVRWTGYYQATSATNYFCTYTDDGVRLYLNGSLVINNWTNHGPTWDCTSNIALTVGVKYSVTMEFFENGGGADAHFTRSSTSAAAAQSLANAIPQVDLYPYGTDPVTSLSVSQGTVSGGINTVFNVSAQAVYGSGATADVTSTATWASANSAIATVSNGVITLVAAGSTTVSVSFGGFTQNINVTVLSKTLTSIAVTPASFSMPVYGTKFFTATATYSDSSTLNITNSVTWSSSNVAKATISNTSPNQGKAIAVAIGSSTITATMGAVSGTSALTINAATLSSIVITPDDYLGLANASYQMTATGTFSDASTFDITDSVTWSSSNTSAATISNSAPTKGVATTLAISNYQTTTLTATLGAVSDTTPFGVNGATVTSILVKPTVSIIIGSTYSLQAWANLSDGGSVDVTQYAAWSSSSIANVTVSNATGARGIVNGIANGVSTVTAQYAGVSGNRVVTVAVSASVTDIGNGVIADYYSWTGGSPPTPFVLANKKGTRIDANIDFSWGGAAAPMGISDNFATRWTGYYKATSTTNYFCTYSDDGVRLWVNGTQVVNNWTDHGGTWDCTGNIAMTIGTKYTIVMEFYENGGGAEAHLTRSSTSAAAAQSLANAILQVDLYSY